MRGEWGTYTFCIFHILRRPMVTYRHGDEPWLASQYVENETHADHIVTFWSTESKPFTLWLIVNHYALGEDMIGMRSITLSLCLCPCLSLPPTPLLWLALVDHLSWTITTTHFKRDESLEHRAHARFDKHRNTRKTRSGWKLARSTELPN